MRSLAGEWGAWHDAGMPVLKRQASPGIPARPGLPSTWITRARPKIDPIACPWLIRRFIDPGAKFLYTAPDTMRARAREEGATPYDIPEVRFAHREELCSLDAFLQDFGLQDPGLDILACIVRGADTARLDLAPQSHGLLAVSLGLSAPYADDHEMLERWMLVYDALYAWIRSSRSAPALAEKSPRQPGPMNPRGS